MDNQLYQTYLKHSTGGISHSASAPKQMKQSSLRPDTYKSDSRRDAAFVAVQQLRASEQTRADLEARVKELTQMLAEARVARELDELRIKNAAEDKKELLALRDTLTKEREAAHQQQLTIDELRTQVGSLQGEIRGLKDSNYRLGELLSCSAEYKVLGRMSKPGVGEGPAVEKQTNIRYLKGSGGVGKKDLMDEIKNVVGKRGLPSKFHWTYKYWDKLSTAGRIEEEDMLWTPERAVEIVKAFLAGDFSKDTDLSVEKLLFEVGAAHPARKGLPHRQPPQDRACYPQVEDPRQTTASRAEVQTE